MNDDNVKLTGKELVDIAVEAGIGAIPVVGGPLQTLYFGSKNEKRFKRIEKFYQELNDDLTKIKNQIPPIDSIPNKDEFLGILEDLNSEVEKAKSQSKIEYFKSFYKNTLLTSNSYNFDTHSFFLETLINLTNLELKILFFLLSQGQQEYSTNIQVDGVSNDLVTGSLSRLTDYGLVSAHLVNITIGGPSSMPNSAHKINDLGCQFSSFILSN